MAVTVKAELGVTVAVAVRRTSKAEAPIAPLVFCWIGTVVSSARTTPSAACARRLTEKAAGPTPVTAMPEMPSEAPARAETAWRLPEAARPTPPNPRLPPRSMKNVKGTGVAGDPGSGITKRTSLIWAEALASRKPPGPALLMPSVRAWSVPRSTSAVATASPTADGPVASALAVARAAWASLPVAPLIATETTAFAPAGGAASSAAGAASSAASAAPRRGIASLPTVIESPSSARAAPPIGRILRPRAGARQSPLDACGPGGRNSPGRGRPGAAQRVPMRRTALLVALLLSLFAAAQGSARDERDRGDRGAMSVEELRREPIAVELDVPYADTGNPRHRLDLYLPKRRASEPLPVVVYFHGGAWMAGDKSDGAGRLLPLLRTGAYAGASAAYRLSGEATWPAQLHDCKAAIRWVRANAERYGFDPERIAVWGRSAGGHLALLVGATGDEPALEGDVGPHAGVSSRVAAVVSFFGVSDLLGLIGQPGDIDRSQPDAPEALLIGGALRAHPERARAASPVAHASAGDPPVLTVHGTDDRTVPFDQAVRLDAALRAAGVPHVLVRVEGAGHGDFGTAADDRVLAFLDRHLRGRRVEVPAAPITDWR